MSRKILVASYASEITTLSFDASVSPPSLAVMSTLDVGHRPSWIAPHTTHKSLVFIVNEETKGAAKALEYDLLTGEGSVMGQASSGGADPCHAAVSPSGDQLIVGNYSGGTVAIIPISPSPPYLSPKPVQVLSFTGSGPLPSRQESSHPHQIVLHPTRQEILVPDLGSDKIWRLSTVNSGRWEIKGHVNTSPGGGPRHAVILHDIIYTLHELTNMLTSHRLPALPASPVPLKVLPTLSEPPKDPAYIDPPPLNAEILCPPTSATFPTPYLYVTNRNDPSPAGDILAIFSVTEGGDITLIREVRTGLTHLRGIAFDEEGRWLIAGGALGGGVKVFERVDGGKDLREVAHLGGIDKPTGFHWLPTT